MMTRQQSQEWGDRIEAKERFQGAARSFQRSALRSRRARQRAHGLVIASYLAVRRQGRLVQLCLPGCPPPESEKRGKCDGMSEDSQKRLLNMLHSIRRDAPLPVMVTLTFPEEVALTPAEAKRCREAWEKRVARKHPKFCAIWRLEAHPQMSARLGRVHPHFHLLTWGAFYDFAWVSWTWTETVWRVLGIDAGLSDARAKHRGAGTSCERVRKWAGVVYCAKTYLAKEEEYPVGEAGRVWGYANKSALPISAEEVIPLTNEQATYVRIAAEEWMREQRIKSEHLVCNFWVDDPSMMVAKLLSKLPLMFQASYV